MVYTYDETVAKNGSDDVSSILGHFLVMGWMRKSKNWRYFAILWRPEQKLYSFQVPTLHGACQKENRDDYSDLSDKGTFIYRV